MKSFLIIAMGAMSAVANAQSIPADVVIEKQVEEWLGRLSLEEKIGQMTQITLDIMGDPASKKNFNLSSDALDNVICKNKVGSILNVPGTAQTPQWWFSTISQIQEKSLECIKVPCIYGLDQNHGATYTTGATFFPQNLSVAASFNRDIAFRAAEITAYETRASDCPWTFSPTLDLGRDPRWPRMYENYGEDAYVNAEMGRAAVRGFQGPDPNHVDANHIAVCLKHFMGYGVPFSGKDRTPAYISPQDIREKHFAPYLASIREGALSIMVNSASINGLPVHANAEYLTQWVKNDLAWDGMIVTDWADIDNLWKREKVAKDKKDAIRIAINAGIDMTMDPYDVGFCSLLKELVEEGAVTMDRINDACARVLRLKLRLGLFERPNTNPADYPEFACKEFSDFALHGAEECIVLLKNNSNILPLGRNTKILVTGPNANSMRALNGGWSYTWQGHLTNDFAKDYNTIYEALSNKFGKDNVILNPGVSYKENGAYHEELAPDIESAVAAAAGVDVIVACIGENSYCETPGNLTDLNISRNQADLVKALAATGKPVIIVLNEGRPRLIADIEPMASAVIEGILPGNYGGDAIANLIAGDANFSARLPFTYPKEINSLVTYDYKVSEEVETMEGAYDYNAVVASQWPFGFGLSYTSYSYSNLRVNKPEFTVADDLEFSVDVTNTGKRAGKEAVLLFSSDLVASQVPDGRRLRAFEKISLKPGETKAVTLKVPASELAFVGYDGHWILEEGDFRIQVGDKVIPIRCTSTYKWTTPNR